MVYSVPPCTLELLAEIVQEEQEETTDVGSSGSDGEATSASESTISGTEDKMMPQRVATSRLSTRCRFSKTQLETIPGTPVATAALPSPPGLSRAAMRRARDNLGTAAVRPPPGLPEPEHQAKGRDALLSTQPKTTSTPVAPETSTVSVNQSTLNASPALMDGHALATMPRAQLDAAAAAVFTRGPCGNPLTPPCKSKKRRALRDAVKPEASEWRGLSATAPVPSMPVQATAPRSVCQPRDATGRKKVPGFVEYNVMASTKPVWQHQTQSCGAPR